VTVSAAMILFGALLIYGGYKNLSISALVRGDNTVSKGSAASGGGGGGASGGSSTIPGGTTSSGATNPPRPTAPPGFTPAGGPR